MTEAEVFPKGLWGSRVSRRPWHSGRFQISNHGYQPGPELATVKSGKPRYTTQKHLHMPVSLKDPNHATIEPASQHVSPTKSLTQATRRQTQRQGRLTSEEPGIGAKCPGPSPATLPVDAHPCLSLHGAFQRLQSLLSSSSTGTAEGVAESLPCLTQVRLSSFSRLATLGP